MEAVRPMVEAFGRDKMVDRGWEGRLWYYEDMEGQEQGPFSTEQMEGWMEAGWLDANSVMVREEGMAQGNPKTARTLARH